MIDNVLHGLQKVKKTGHGRWLACCPVHDDRSPSLAIRLIDDGRILIHCFGCGCGIDEFCRALGIGIDELFPPKPDNERGGWQRERRPFSAQDVLDALIDNVAIIAIGAGELIAGEELSAADQASFCRAYDAISQAVSYAK